MVMLRKVCQKCWNNIFTMLKWYIQFVDFFKVQIIQKYIEIGSYFVVLILNNIQVQMESKIDAWFER